MKALALANQVRSARAAILQPLRRGEIRIGDIDLNAPELQSMLVVDLLASLRWRRRASSGKAYKQPARKKAYSLIQHFGCLPRTRLGTLTPERKAALVRLVEAEVPAQREDW